MTRPSWIGGASFEAYKELELGIVITVDENTQKCNSPEGAAVLVVPVAGQRLDRRRVPLVFVGCASKAVAFSHMPPFKDKTGRLDCD